LTCGKSDPLDCRWGRCQAQKFFPAVAQAAAFRADLTRPQLARGRLVISSWRIGFLSVAIAVLLPASASALTQQQIDQCVNNNAAYSLDLEIEACTAAI
jgi:hypothetical protein